MTHATPTPVQTVLDLFSTDLRDLRFADVDAARLTAAAADLEAAAVATAAAQTALDDARAHQLALQDTLTSLVQRALAYARVYAESNPALASRLDAVSLPRVVRRSTRVDDATIASTSETAPTRRPRGRPRKVPPAIAAAELATPLDATGE